MLLRVTTFLTAVALLFAAPAMGATSTPPGVARVSVVERGTVVLTRGDKNKTQAQIVAMRNAPVFPGDFLSTTDTSTLAEIQLDGYAALRLSGDVQARLVSNDANGRQIQLAQGLVELAILHKDAGASEIVAPPVTVRAEVVGDYRVWVDSDGTTTITARTGQAEIVTPRKVFTAEPGETVVARGEAADPSVQYVAEIARDSFDDFNRDRNRALFAALNENVNVPENIASYDNLSSYGRWADVPPYGESWIPNQVSDWAPYRYGTWVWGTSYGWTWVGNEPWGWLPYHYGSWFYASGYGWCWYPPAFSVVPIWVPAFVAFFGYGSSPFGYPYFGWVPLAPYESFYPWYPWYWGWYYPWPQYYHPPPPQPRPPPHRGPIRMHPLAAAYRNLRFDGASALDGRVDAGRLENAALERGTLPPQLFRDREPRSAMSPARPVALSPLFDRPRFASSATLPRIPMPQGTRETNAARSWDRFYSSRGTVPVTRSMTESAMHEAFPVIREAPLGREPSEPVGHLPSAPGHEPSAPVHDPGSTAGHGGESHSPSRPPA